MIEKLSKEQLDLILDALPVEISFVDVHDTVQFWNKGGKRILKGPPSGIGEAVQDCHPRDSVYKVNEILTDFKTGHVDSAEFWIDRGEQKIYIRFFAVRDKSGDYLGTLEVVQDITDIQKIKGEKRLLEY